MPARPFACLGLALALAACGALNADAPPAFTGYVEADLAYVAAPEAGWITVMNVAEGDAVGPGDALFSLDDDSQRARREEARSRVAQADAQARDLETGARQEEIAVLESELEEAEAALSLAITEARRAAELVQRNIAAQSRLDQARADRDRARARVNALSDQIEVAQLGGRAGARDAAGAARAAAEAALDQAEWAVDQRHVSARVSGQVEHVFLRAGEYATPGQPVLSVLDPDRLEVRFFAPQHALSRLSLGDDVEATCDACPEPISARITFIAQTAEFTPPVIFSEASRESLVFLVKARPEAGAGLRPGQPVDVRLPQ